VRLSTSRTFQLDQDLAGFDLVDEIREPAVTPGAADLDLSNWRHVGPPQRAWASARSTTRTKLSRGCAPESQLAVDEEGRRAAVRDGCLLHLT